VTSETSPNGRAFLTKGKKRYLLAERFTEIAVHENPHLDEIVACYLLMREGERIFPGVRKADIVVWGENGDPDGKSIDRCLAEGTIPVGIGGGPFDEHVEGGGERRENHCCATLVADYLGVRDDCRYSKLLRFTLSTDVGPAKHEFDLSSLVKIAYKSLPEGGDSIAWTRKVMETVMWHLENIVRTQQAFLRSEVIPHETIELRRGGRTITMVAVETANREFHRWAMSWRGREAGIVVRRDPESQTTQILTSDRISRHLKLGDVIARLRYEELLRRGVRHDKVPDIERLRVAGTITQVPEWHGDERLCAIFNGTSTHPDVPKTQLSLEEIVAIVRDTIY
jgi:hypothetical protein